MFLISLFLITNILMADNVQPVIKNEKNIDLRYKFGPIMDQGTMGFCYAFSFADLISYHLGQTKLIDTTKKENMVSALGLAMLYNNEERGMNFRTYELYKSMLKNPKLERELEQKKKKLKNLQIKYEEIVHKAEEKDLEFIDLKKQEKELCVNNHYNYDCIGVREKMYARKEIILEQIKQQIDPITKEINQLSRDIAALESIKEFKNKELKEQEGGWPTALYNVILENGFCLEKQISSDRYANIEADFEIKTFPTNIAGLNSLDHNVYSSKNSNIFEDVNAAKERKTTQKELNKTTERVSATFNLPEKKIKRIIRKSKRKPSFDAIETLYNSACTPHKLDDFSLSGKWSDKFNLQETPGKIGENNKELLDIINSELNKNNPVYISYNTRLFLYPNPNYFEEQINSHASLIVGRKYNYANQRYEYIVRNTWGPKSCDRAYEAFDPLVAKDYDDCRNTNTIEGSVDFDKMMSCLEDKKSKAIRPFSCDLGYYMVEQESLARSLNYIFYITPKQNTQQKMDYPTGS